MSEITQLSGRRRGVRGPSPGRGRGRSVVPIPADRVAHLVATAARAPSVHNTQP
jgi:hypothetical protein